MSNLVKCERDSLQSTTSEGIRIKNVKTVVTGLDKLLSFLEKDKYIDSITKFKLKSPISNPQQNNGCFCHKKTIDMGCICSICLSIFCKHHKKCSTCGSVFGQAQSDVASASDLKRKTPET